MAATFADTEVVICPFADVAVMQSPWNLNQMALICRTVLLFLIKQMSASRWLQNRVGMTPKTSIGWFRAGVGFYNKRKFEWAVECLREAVALDPNNYNGVRP